jgi:hypothetical protein
MIKLEKTDVFGWEAAIRGMRNPMNSWDKSDSIFLNDYSELGKSDCELMMKLAKAGTDHSKFLRMINVTVDITAPLYWWKEYDTYKVGTVANSCSTMHKIHAKEFTLDDFSHEHLDEYDESLEVLETVIKALNEVRDIYVNGYLAKHYSIPKGVKDYWWQMIQLLPSSYNQKRTVQLNYQVLKSMYFARKSHKLDEWREFCKWCESLPYFYEICINI